MSDFQSSENPYQDPQTESQPEPHVGSPTKDECNMAMLAHLLGIFTWFIGPLIIWLMKKDESAFINDQGKEALNFQITLGIVYVGIGILSIVTCGLASPLIIFPVIAAIVFCIMAAMAANKGQNYRYPLSIRMIS